MFYRVRDFGSGNIIVPFDTSSNSLQKAQKSWKDVNGLESKHKLYLAKSFDSLK